MDKFLYALIVIQIFTTKMMIRNRNGFSHSRSPLGDFFSIAGLINADSTMIKVCSYIPFASPMAIIVRVATGTITSVEFII